MDNLTRVKGLTLEQMFLELDDLLEVLASYKDSFEFTLEVEATVDSLSNKTCEVLASL